MAQVSKYLISSDVYQRCWEIFIKTLIGIRNPKDAQHIITDLLTPTERIMLVKRLAIAMLLFQRYQYREISKILRVSVATIWVVNLALKHGNGGYIKAISKIQRDENLIKLFNKIAQTVAGVGVIGGKGSGTWRSLKRELENQPINKRPF